MVSGTEGKSRTGYFVLVSWIYALSYVVCTTRRPFINWSASSDPSSSKSLKAEEPQQVFIGIFPASHIHRRDELPDAEGRLALVAHEFAQGKRPPPSIIDDRESRKSFKLGPPPDQAASSRACLSRSSA